MTHVETQCVHTCAAGRSEERRRKNIPHPRKNRRERARGSILSAGEQRLEKERGSGGFSYLIFPVAEEECNILRERKESPPVNSSFRKHIRFIRKSRDSAAPTKGEGRTPFQFTWQILADSRRLPVERIEESSATFDERETERKREGEGEEEKWTRETNVKIESKIYNIYRAACSSLRTRVVIIFQLWKHETSLPCAIFPLRVSLA